MTNVVLVSGGRTLNDRNLVFNTLDRIYTEKGIEVILTGACPNRKTPDGKPIWSADMLAQHWAIVHEIIYLGVPAKWKTGGHGAAEGPIRNRKMAELMPHYAVLFPGGNGTSDMLKHVIDLNIPYEVVSG